MVKRIVRTGIGTYLRPEGQGWFYGVLGEEVDVHEDDVERFDRLNGVDEVISDDVDGEPVEIVGEEFPDAGDSSWTHDRIDGYAKDHGISYDGIEAKNPEKPNREEKVAHIVKATPAAVATPVDQP